MRVSLIFAIYIIVGILVAAGIIGDERNYFSNLGNIEDIIEMILAVLLWPLVLLGMDINIGGLDSNTGNGGSSHGAGGGGSGGGK
jgi:hypothetical protein